RNIIGRQVAVSMFNCKGRRRCDARFRFLVSRSAERYVKPITQLLRDSLTAAEPRGGTTHSESGDTPPAPGVFSVSQLQELFWPTRSSCLCQEANANSPNCGKGAGSSTLRK